MCRDVRSCSTLPPFQSPPGVMDSAKNLYSAVLDSSNIRCVTQHKFIVLLQGVFFFLGYHLLGTFVIDIFSFSQLASR